MFRRAPVAFDDFARWHPAVVVEARPSQPPRPRAPRGAIDRLLAEYPWLSRDDLVEDVVRRPAHTRTRVRRRPGADKAAPSDSDDSSSPAQGCHSGFDDDEEDDRPPPLIDVAEELAMVRDELAGF